MKYTCPVCKKSLKGSPAEGAEKAEFFPFCSRRCKLIDLGAWFDADYKIITDLPHNKQIQQPKSNQGPSKKQ